MRSTTSFALTLLLGSMGMVGANASQTIYSATGDPASRALEGPSLATPVPRQSQASVIDSWFGGADLFDWSLNSSFYWATAFDTNDLVETFEITEVRWFADGGETEDYWVAPDAGGFPDTSQAVYLGGQAVPASGFQWQSYATTAGALVEPAQVYWFIRATSPLDSPGMTWRSTTNPAPAIANPVSISQDFNTGWAPWVTGLDWQMEYEIIGDPAGGGQVIGGSVTGVTSSATRCINRTTGQSITIPLAGASTWDCTAAGLTAAPGDQILQINIGTAD